MNKQFRDRLTGAVILVILIVVVVPALLSGPPPSSPVTAQRAEDGTPLRSYTIDLTDPAAPSQATASPTPPPRSAPSPSAAPPPPSLTPPETAQSPAAPAQSAPTQSAPAVLKGFAVQVGSFSERANADRVVAQLKKQGFEVFLSPTAAPKRLYRVRVGPVATRAEAERVATRLAAANRPGKIVPHP